MAASERVLLTLDMTDELNERLNLLAVDAGGSKADVLRKAIALVDVAICARKTGQQLAIVDKEGRVVSKIVGL